MWNPVTSLSLCGLGFAPIEAHHQQHLAVLNEAEQMTVAPPGFKMPKHSGGTKNTAQPRNKMKAKASRIARKRNRK